MKQISINISLCFLICFGFSACKKQLNVYPTTSEVDGNIISNVNGASVALNGVYSMFANAGKDYFGVPTINWYYTNETVPSELSGLVYSIGNNDQFLNFDFVPSSSGVDEKWNYCYKIINAANGFLKNLEPLTEISDSLKKQMQGEARFLRAYANEELLLYYGQYKDPSSKYGIILRDEFVATNTIYLPRATVEEVYNSILSDLDFAIGALPGANKNKGYANKWTAKLLKARVLLNRGAGDDYAQVITVTDDIIQNSPFSLEDNEKDIFLTKGFSSNEVMLTAQPFPTETSKYEEYQVYFSFPANEKLVNLLQDDARMNWVIKPVSDPYWGDIHEMSKYYSGDVDNPAQTPLSENCYAMRLAEAYLSQAEAIALSNGDLPTGKTLLKEVMTRGGAGAADIAEVDAASSGPVLQELVVKETMKNFVAENGLDWLALRRLPFATLQQFRPEITSADLLILPIPSNEMHTNSKMTQNPGYPER